MLAVMSARRPFSDITGLEPNGMLTLFSYPGLFGVADNNPYGLKVFAFMKLCRLEFRHEHIFDAKDAPRGQLPYLRDGETIVGDSDAVIAYLIDKFALPIDDGLIGQQRDAGHFVRRTLDDLYWVMSYSRWKDERFWPLFRDAILRTHKTVTAGALEQAREYNFKRYHYQGIGRYEPDEVYARGIADLNALGNFLPARGFLFGDRPTSADAGLYGFVANILFYEIDTPLKAFLLSRRNLVAQCRSVHTLVG
jgi:glutathione S-transferase